jgi:hypothetical protein
MYPFKINFINSDYTPPTPSASHPVVIGRKLILRLFFTLLLTASLNLLADRAFSAATLEEKL